MRIDIRPSTPIKDGDNVLGKHTKVKIVKNKVAPPFKRCEFDVMFGEGISKSSEIIDLGVEYGIIQKSGSWFSYNGAKLAQGRDAAKLVIDDNPELAEEIGAKLLEALKGGDAPAGAKKKSAAKTADKTADAPKDDADFDTTDPDDLSDVTLDDDLDEDFTLEENV